MVILFFLLISGFNCLMNIEYSVFEDKVMGIVKCTTKCTWEIVRNKHINLQVNFSSFATRYEILHFE